MNAPDSQMIPVAINPVCEGQNPLNPQEEVVNIPSNPNQCSKNIGKSQKSAAIIAIPDELK